MSNTEKLANLMAEILALKSPGIDQQRQEQISSFIQTTVNGDALQQYVTFIANLSKDKQGALVYALTNRRLIRIDIDEKEINSSSHLLGTMTGVNRRLIDGNRMFVEVAFQSGTVGLQYSGEKKITDFFQAVEQSRVGAAGNG